MITNLMRSSPSINKMLEKHEMSFFVQKYLDYVEKVALEYSNPQKMTPVLRNNVSSWLWFH